MKGRGRGGGGEGEGRRRGGGRRGEKNLGSSWIISIENNVSSNEKYPLIVASIATLNLNLGYPT